MYSNYPVLSITVGLYVLVVKGLLLWSLVRESLHIHAKIFFLSATFASVRHGACSLSGSADARLVYSAPCVAVVDHQQRLRFARRGSSLPLLPGIREA